MAKRNKNTDPKQKDLFNIQEQLSTAACVPAIREAVKNHNLNNSARESQTIPEVLLSIIPNFLMNLILSTDRIWSSATCPWRF